MNFGRIFANAVARRIAYLVVAAAFAWLVGCVDAKAQSGCPANSQPSSGSGCGSQTAALSACQAAAASYTGAKSAACETPTIGATWGYYVCRRNGTATGCNTAGQFYYFLKVDACSARPNTTFSHDLVIPTGSVGCGTGCAFQVNNNGDGTYTRVHAYLNNETCNVLPSCTQPGWYLNHATSLCQPPEVECPANKTKNPKTGACEEACPTGLVMDATGACKPSTDDCPAGNVRAPSGQCLPGDGQCAAGEARRPNGTCGVDSDGDGQADEDDDNPDNDPDRETASGGDSCSAPPSCSGGPIDCLQAKIQWRIDCNTRHKVNVTGGACGAMPVCVGENCKAMEYAQLLQQWKAACALEKLANAEDGGEGGNNADLIALLTGPGSINGEHGDTGGMPGGDGPFQWGEGEDHEPDTTGFGYGSSCPSPPSFTVGGRTISIDLTIMCQWVSLAGSIVLVLAGLASVRIVSGGIA